WPSSLLRLRLLNASAEITQQGLELVLFVGLCGIVRWPRLGVGGFLRSSQYHALSHGNASVRIEFASHHENGCIDVLALAATSFVIRASAFRMPMGNMADPIGSLASLRRNNPASPVPADCPRCRQFHAALFSQVHSALVYLRNILLDRYISVKRNLILDNILLSRILFTLWAWSRSRKRVINVIAVPMNGNREKAQSASRGFVRHASRHTGISRENTTSRRGNPSLSKSLAEGLLPHTSDVH